MTQIDNDRIEAAVARRLEAVESLVPATPQWRGADEADHGSSRIVVVGGPAFRQGTRGEPRFGLLLVAAAAILAVFAFSVIGGLGALGPVPGWADRFPLQTADTFERPFTYATDPASGIERDEVTPRFVQFATRDPADPTRFNRIVAIRVVDLVRVDPCRSNHGGTTSITAPQQFLDYLRSIPGLSVSGASAATVDGRSALQVDVTTASKPTCSSVYIWPSEGAFTDTAAARRIYLLDVDGATILVAVAVAEPSDLDAWLPTADQFIATLHFLPTSPDSSAQP